MTEKPTNPTPVVQAQPDVPQQQPMPQNIQYIVQEKSLTGVGGWLIFWLIVFGLNALNYIWWFFLALIGVVEGDATGAGLALIIETLVFSLLLTVASALTVVFIAMSKKLGRLLAYVTLGLSALFVTVVSVTTMTITRPDCTYDYSTLSGYTRECTEAGQPAAVIIGLIGAIFVSWLAAFLIALYFKLSKRVAQTLVK